MYLKSRVFETEKYRERGREKEIEGERGREGERQREIFYPLFTSQMIAATMAGHGEARSEKLHLGLLDGYRSPNTWPMLLSGSWVRSRAIGK